jgi:hypothetical protein
VAFDTAAGYENMGRKTSKSKDNEIVASSEPMKLEDGALDFLKHSARLMRMLILKSGQNVNKLDLKELYSRLVNSLPLEEEDLKAQLLENAENEEYFRVEFLGILANKISNNNNSSSSVTDRTLRLALLMGCSPDVIAFTSVDVYTSMQQIMAALKTDTSSGPDLAFSVAIVLASSPERELQADTAAREFSRVYLSRLLMTPVWVTKRPYQTAFLWVYGELVLALTNASGGSAGIMLAGVLGSGFVTASKYLQACIGAIALWHHIFQLRDTQRTGLLSILNDISKEVEFALSTLLRKKYQLVGDELHMIGLLCTACQGRGPVGAVSGTAGALTLLSETCLLGAGVDKLRDAVKIALSEDVDVEDEDSGEDISSFLNWFAEDESRLEAAGDYLLRQLRGSKETRNNNAISDDDDKNSDSSNDSKGEEDGSSDGDGIDFDIDVEGEGKIGADKIELEDGLGGKESAMEKELKGLT